MDINEWGPAAWKFLHSATFAVDLYPSHDMQTKLRNFFQTLPYMLPCKICRKHFLEYAEQHPVDTSSRENLTRWLVDLHNNVNTINNKPSVKYVDVENIYSYSKSRTVHKNRKAKLGITIIVVVIIVVVVILSIALLVHSCVKGRCPLV